MLHLLSYLNILYDFMLFNKIFVNIYLFYVIDLDETCDLIGKAGYALTHSRKFDIIIEYFIPEGNYNSFEMEVAGHFGISKDYAANYHCDEEGTALNYEVLNEAICRVREENKPLSADWKERIDADYEKRKLRGFLQTKTPEIFIFYIFFTL